MDLEIRRAFRVILRKISALADSARTQATSIATIAGLTPRRAQVSFTTLAVNTPQTATASWAVGIAGDYRVSVTPVIATARLGTVFAGVVPGTKTATSVDITIVNLGATTVATAAVDVIAFPDN